MNGLKPTTGIAGADRSVIKSRDGVLHRHEIAAQTHSTIDTATDHPAVWFDAKVMVLHPREIEQLRYCFDQMRSRRPPTSPPPVALSIIDLYYVGQRDTRREMAATDLPIVPAHPEWVKDLLRWTGLIDCLHLYQSGKEQAYVLDTSSKASRMQYYDLILDNQVQYKLSQLVSWLTEAKEHKTNILIRQDVTAEVRAAMRAEFTQRLETDKEEARREIRAELTETIREELLEEMRQNQPLARARTRLSEIAAGLTSKLPSWSISS